MYGSIQMSLTKVERRRRPCVVIRAPTGTHVKVGKLSAEQVCQVHAAHAAHTAKASHAAKVRGVHVVDARVVAASLCRVAEHAIRLVA